MWYVEEASILLVPGNCLKLRCLAHASKEKPMGSLWRNFGKKIFSTLFTLQRWYHENTVVNSIITKKTPHWRPESFGFVKAVSYGDTRGRKENVHDRKQGKCKPVHKGILSSISFKKFYNYIPITNFQVLASNSKLYSVPVVPQL